MNKRIAFTLIAAALLAAPVDAASLVINGDFETGDTSGWTRFEATLPGGGTLMRVQTAGVLCGDGIPVFLPCLPAHSGLYDMAFGGDMNLFDIAGREDVLAQTLSTVAGQSYALDFWMAQDSPGRACCYNEFRVFWNGAPVLATKNLSSGNYIDYQLLLVATSETSTLGFGSMNLLGWNRLDDVRLAAVPEPATFALLGLGLVVAASSSIARRRSNALSTVRSVPL